MAIRGARKSRRGRPKTIPGDEVVVITTRLDKALWQDLHHLADLRGQTVAAILRNAARETVEAETKNNPFFREFKAYRNEHLAPPKAPAKKR